MELASGKKISCFAKREGLGQRSAASRGRRRKHIQITYFTSDAVVKKLLRVMRFLR